MRHDCSPECDESKRSVSSENAAVLRQSRVADDDFGIVGFWAAMRPWGGAAFLRYVKRRLAGACAAVRAGQTAVPLPLRPRRGRKFIQRCVACGTTQR